MSSSAVSCWIYRSKAKEGMYLYLAREEDFDCVPELLRKGMGRLEFSMQLELAEDSRLAREDVSKVIENLQDRGFHLQMPPKDFLPDMYYGD